MQTASNNSPSITHKESPSLSSYTFPAPADSTAVARPATPKSSLRLNRRLSHPPSTHANRVRSEQEDGDFIKRAFENLTVESHDISSAPSSFSLAREETATAPKHKPREDDAVPSMTELQSTVLSTYPPASRNSFASSISQPVSAVSGLSSHLEVGSICSSYPLLPHAGSSRFDNITSTQDYGPGRHKHARTPSNSALNPFQDDVNAARAGDSSSMQPPRPLRLQRQPSVEHHSLTYGVGQGQGWIDPFAEVSEASRLRLRRRSTISGFSVSSADWSSLRRGSLPSVENVGPVSPTYNYSQRPRNGSANPTHHFYNGNGNGSGNSLLPSTDASIYASMARERQTSSSLRWESWVAAYRDSVLQHNNIDTGSMAPRYSLLSETPNAPHMERPNYFTHLRRQFVAKAGSRSESNRILVLELCHALEEYATVIAVLCKIVQSGSGEMLLSSLSLPSTSLPASERQSSNPPSPIYSGMPPASPRTKPSQMSLDKVQLELLAAEVDSLVREIVEAVPAFSYSLGQGKYGPLPFLVNNLRATAPDITIRRYLTQVHIIPSGFSSFRRHVSTRPYTAPGQTIQREQTATPGDSPELETISADKWWPNRLRADLTEGLLVEAADDSPKISLQSISVMPSSPYRQDASTVDPLSSCSTAPTSRAAHDELTLGESSTSGRTGQLMAEGMRRWQDYVQGRR